MKDRNIKLFYWHELLFRFSDDMLMIVLPIFIYKLYGSISAVFIFTMTWNLIHGLFFIPIFNLAMKLKKPKYIMMLGVIFYVASLYVFSLNTLEDRSMIPAATLLFSLYMSCYWMLRHWFTASNITPEKIGKQMSTIYIIGAFITFVSPIAGGVVSYFISFNATFILGAIAGILSLIPIALFHAPGLHEKYSLKKILNLLKEPYIKDVRPAYFLEGFNFSVFIDAWILIFFIYIGNILDLGLLVGITGFMTAIIVWVIGQRFDQKNRKKVLEETTIFRAISTALYAIVVFWPNMIYVWVVQFLNRLTTDAQYTVVDSYFYACSNKKHPVHMPIARELCLAIIRPITSGALALVFYFVSTDYLWVPILLGAASVMGMLYLKRSDHLLH